MEELRGLTGREVVGVLRERYAEGARQRAALLEAVWETVRSDEADSSHRLSGADEWSDDEVRAALGLTRRAASRLVDEARTVMYRLPMLGEAMAAGELDAGRAAVFREWTAELSDSHALSVVESLLPRCRLSAPTQLTTGQLAGAIQTMAVALDPEWARRRYEAKLEQRRVVATRDAEGTASLSGLHLPVERVAASSARIEDLARAAKRAGDSRPINHIRADLYLGMTDGTYEGLRREEILAALLAHTTPPGAGHSDNPSDTVDGLEPGGPGAGRALDRESTRPLMPAPERSWAGVELRVRLSTLLGLDRFPGELAGWGTCHAELARQLVSELGAAQWRYVFTCPDGYLLRTGLLAARPAGVKKRRASCKAVVEIVVPSGLLPLLLGPDAHLSTAVATDLLSAWDLVLGDLKDKLAEPATQRLLDPRRRAPGAALRREVTTAINTCVGPGCRTPSRSGDIDHLTDHAKGGDTVEKNLDPLCRHDHRVKTEAGWQLRRVKDNFEWTTRLGQVYLSPIEPVLPEPPRSRHTEPPPF